MFEEANWVESCHVSVFYNVFSLFSQGCINWPGGRISLHKDEDRITASLFDGSSHKSNLHFSYIYIYLVLTQGPL